MHLSLLARWGFRCLLFEKESYYVFSLPWSLNLSCSASASCKELGLHLASLFYLHIDFHQEPFEVMSKISVLQMNHCTSIS